MFGVEAEHCDDPHHPNRWHIEWYDGGVVDMQPKQDGQYAVEDVPWFIIEVHHT